VIPRDTIKLATEGLWNSGIVPAGDGFLLLGNTQRPHVKWFDFLDSSLAPKNSPREFRLAGGFDFRLFTHGPDIYTAYSSKFATFRGAVAVEKIEIPPAGALVRSLAIHSPDTIEDWPGYKKVSAEKNWMPFDVGADASEIHFVYSVVPHRIVKFELKTQKVRLLHSENWTPKCPWCAHGFWGNANVVPCGDFFFAMFHTKADGAYWTGYYLFERRAPYRPVRICKEPLWTPAMSLEEKRSERVARVFKNVIFPVGAVSRHGEIIVSYGENDFFQKFAIFKERDLLEGTEPV